MREADNLASCVIKLLRDSWLSTDEFSRPDVTMGSWRWGVVGPRVQTTNDPGRSPPSLAGVEPSTLYDGGR